MAFFEAEFPRTISYKAVGGPSMNTFVVEVASGAEQRNRNWAAARRRYTISLITPTSVSRQTFADALETFFLMVGGKADGFRFFDHLSHSATNEPVAAIHLSLSRALSFDGSDDYVAMGNPPVLAQDFSAFTLCGWVKVAGTAGGAEAGLFGKFTVCGMTLFGTTPQLYGYVNAGGNNVNASYAAFVSGWHHVAQTFDGSTMRLLVDGDEIASNASGYATTGTGGSFNLGLASDYFNGRLADVRMYSRVLSSAELGGLVLGTEPSRSGLVGRWPLQEGAGNTAHDMSGNLDAGTLTPAGGPTWVTDAIFPSGSIQLQRVYSLGGRSYTQTITKPITAAVIDYQGAALSNTVSLKTGAGATRDPASYSVDPTTGIITGSVDPTDLATFDYHIPVRLDSDDCHLQVEDSHVAGAGPIVSWNSLALVEVRPPDY